MSSMLTLQYLTTSAIKFKSAKSVHVEALVKVQKVLHGEADQEMLDWLYGSGSDESSGNEGDEVDEDDDSCEDEDKSDYNDDEGAEFLMGGGWLMGGLR